MHMALMINKDCVHTREFSNKENDFLLSKIYEDFYYFYCSVIKIKRNGSFQILFIDKLYAMQLCILI